jgi:DNA repair protein RadC
VDLYKLARVRGLRDAKAARLKAALSPEEGPQVASRIEMASLEQEQLRVVLFDTRYRLRDTRTLYQGTTS